MNAAQPATPCGLGALSAKHELGPIEGLLARERARHHGELQQTQEQVARLLTLPTASLVAALDDDLAALAIATLEAMSALRRMAAQSEPDAPIEPGTHMIGTHLTQVAHLTRSTHAIHLSLEAQVGPAPS